MISSVRRLWGGRAPLVVDEGVLVILQRFRVIQHQDCGKTVDSGRRGAAGTRFLGFHSNPVVRPYRL